MCTTADATTQSQVSLLPVSTSEVGTQGRIVCSKAKFSDRVPSQSHCPADSCCVAAPPPLSISSQQHWTGSTFHANSPKSQNDTHCASGHRGPKGLLSSQVLVPPLSSLPLWLPSPTSPTHCCSLDNCLLFCTSCSPSILDPERLQLMAHVRPFYLRGLTYPVPLRHSSTCTCFGPQCPQKPTGWKGVTQVKATNLKKLALPSVMRVTDTML